ncbi:hypothetical protein CSC75_12460 [Pseudoxanthomonas wuyuanensis]|nr:hypothetical protein CSC75_12460 [Pseudoxanthomonas wuyuanensis]
MDSQLQACEKSDAYRGNPQYVAFVESCDARSKKFGQRLKSLSSSLAACDAKTSAEAEVDFYQATRRAAANNDTDAQICYVRGTFFVNRPWTEQEKDDYKKEAQAYTKAAFERGDWRIVELLRVATPEVIAQSGLMGTLVNGERTSIYKMNRLLRRGTLEGKYQKLLDALAEDPEAPLPIATKAEADLWVARTYERSFAQSPRLQDQPDTCVADGIGD